MIIYLIIFVIILWIWMLYEFHRAPYIDKDGKEIKKDKNDTRT